MRLSPLIKSIFGIGLIFSLATLWLYFLSTFFSSSGTQLHFPKTLEDLKKLSNDLQEYKDQNYLLVLILFCSAYVYKQTFAIPGSALMNILGGALFGTLLAFPLVCFLTAVGATFCFTLSKKFGRRILIKKFPDKIHSIESKISENKDHLFYFLLSARLFPFSPNWLMNMILPIIGIRKKLFFFSVFFGLMPYNFICVQTGSFLRNLKSLNDIFSYSTLFGMFLIATAAMLPGLALKYKTKSLEKTKV